MSYNPSIPQSGDRPSASQSQILTNFTQLNSIFGQEHVTFNATADNGEHTKITLNNVLGADPNLADPKSSLYTKTVAGDSQLFFENFDVGGAANIVRQLTDLVITSGAKHGGTQYTLLTPWGLRITMGLTTAFSGTSTDTFITAFTSTIYTAVCTGIDPNPQQVALTVNNTTLNLVTANFVSVRYLVIGD
jgi:hypothetical protein